MGGSLYRCIKQASANNTGIYYLIEVFLVLGKSYILHRKQKCKIPAFLSKLCLFDTTEVFNSFIKIISVFGFTNKKTV